MCVGVEVIQRYGGGGERGSRTALRIEEAPQDMLRLDCSTLTLKCLKLLGFFLL